MFNETVKFKVSVSYDGNSPHWNKAYNSFSEAVKAYETFNDWGFCDEFSIVTLHAGEFIASKEFRRPN